MIKAVFTDFYGTLVYEDGAVIEKICNEIFNTGNAESKSQIGSYWWQEFQTSFINSFGDNFKTQRELEHLSLVKTTERFQSPANVEKLSEMMFEHWVKPPVFEDTELFFEMCPVPVYIVSNIDRADILAAIEYHSFKPSGIFTSEDAKAYKPRKELFELAIKTVGISANEAVHIGDSLSSDVGGAASVGINAVWLNRNNREVLDGIVSVRKLTELFDTMFFKRNIKGTQS